MVKRKEKGVTLIETIIAMALVSIVSSIVVLTCNFSSRAKQNNKLTQFFINETESVLVCYYSNDFYGSLSFLTDKIITNDETTKSYTLYYSSDLAYTEEENAKFSLTINYEDELNVKVISTNLSNEKIIYSYGGANGQSN